MECSYLPGYRLICQERMSDGHARDSPGPSVHPLVVPCDVGPQRLCRVAPVHPRAARDAQLLLGVYWFDDTGKRAFAVFRPRGRSRDRTSPTAWRTSPSSTRSPRTGSAPRVSRSPSTFEQCALPFSSSPVFPAVASGGSGSRSEKQAGSRNPNSVSPLHLM